MELQRVPGRHSMESTEVIEGVRWAERSKQRRQCGRLTDNCP